MWCPKAEEVWKSCYSWLDIKPAFPSSMRTHYWQHVLMIGNKENLERWRLVWCCIVWVFLEQQKQYNDEWRTISKRKNSAGDYVLYLVVDQVI